MRGQLASPVLRGARASNGPRLLDSMRLRPIEQMAAKVAGALEKDEPDMATFLTERLPNIRHQMWNGQWHPAIARMKRIYQGTAEATTRMGGAIGDHIQRFRRHIRDLRDYLVHNQTSLTNYAYAVCGSRVHRRSPE